MSKNFLSCLVILTLILALIIVKEPQLSVQAQPNNKKNATLELAEAQKDPDFLLQGEYARDGLGIQVVAKGKGKFMIVSYKGGLPGAGYDGKNRQVLDDENAEAVQLETKELKKVERESTTLNLKAPAGAVVLFDGTKETFEKNWQKGARMSTTGHLHEGCTSIPTFQDYTLHAEFMLSYMPEATGQGRSNSGLYHQARYETQVLDSFGLEGLDDELGGIYSVKAPSLNMAFPPLRWQTYDVDFKSARFDAAGKKLANARLTVKVNGVVVQNDVEVPAPTPASPVKDETPASGPLYIQNHSNPLLFRNIWVMPKDAQREDARPKISSLERFQHGSQELPSATAGFILLGELNCTSCHQAGSEWKEYITNKEAPILTEAGSRINHDYFSQFFANNHTLKPGTTMPEVLHQIPDTERDAVIQALSEFMKSTGNLEHTTLDKTAIKRGEKLFHEVGCAVCHGSTTREPATALLNTSIPLGKLELKYSINSLIQFLKNPHAVRPSGRMPAFSLKEQDVSDVAQYLLTNLDPKYQNNGATYEVFEGSYKMLPDFSQLKPIKTGQGQAFDLSFAEKEDSFAMRFTGEINITRPGNYKITLGSDDGSRLLVDGEELIRVDGVHPHSTSDKEIKLSKGKHSVVVEYFEDVGQNSLSVEIEGKELPKTSLANMISPPGSIAKSSDDAIKLDDKLIAMGKTHFLNLGCANCHTLKQNEQDLKTTLKSVDLVTVASKLSTTTLGCLAATPQPKVPWYSLSDQQLSSIKAALKIIAESKTKSQKPAPRETAELLNQQLMTNNCYACHVRGGIGGPETSRNSYFVCTIPEMGDEGRLPPILDGVGDKLQDGYLDDVWNKGVDQRPYMLTAMPKFGGNNVKSISDHVIKLDRKTEANPATFDEPEFRTKAQGRLLAGEKGLACVKCHTFDKYPATGIQAVALDKMTSRLREDWFRRYLFEPTKYRPGTRMPTGYPEGKATIKDVYEGHPDQQIASLWQYLKDGNNAAVPAGLIPNPIELIPTDKPVIYRNFIKDVSPRGIAVGYPQKINLTFDADKNALKLLWHGAFIDASLHWRGRGQGNQTPLGDQLIKYEPQNPFLDNSQQALTFKFKGYQLNDLGQPSFNYSNEDFQINDFPAPVLLEKQAAFNRTITIKSTTTNKPLEFVAASGKSITTNPDGSFLIDGYLHLKISGDVNQHKIDTKDGNQRLIFTIKQQPQASITQHIKW